jgi:hypothetical protein
MWSNAQATLAHVIPTNHRQTGSILATSTQTQHVQVEAGFAPHTCPFIHRHAMPSHVHLTSPILTHTLTPHTTHTYLHRAWRDECHYDKTHPSNIVAMAGPAYHNKRPVPIPKKTDQPLQFTICLPYKGRISRESPHDLLV